MPKRLQAACLAAAIVVAACDGTATAPELELDPTLSAAQTSQQESRRILYQMNGSATDADMRALGRVLARYEITRNRSLANGRVDLASIRNRGGRDEHAIAAELMATGAVEFAEVDALLEPDALPSDTLYYRQWHHTTMHSPIGWDIATGSASVIVAVCDTGIELTHPDLAANIFGTGHNLVDGSPDGSYITSHGTKVAGMLGAVGNNVEGVAGVNWSVSILSLRVTNRTDGLASLSTLVACIDYARTRGAKAVNVSYGGVRASSSANAAGEALKAAGGLLFVSAGNDGMREGSTKNHPGIIVVGATDSLDAKATFSNYGKMIDVVAPGARVTTTQLTTNIGQGPYVRGENGTSFAAPLAAGLAALTWSARPELSPAAVQDVIFRSSTDLGSSGYDELFGHGRIDVGVAVTMALTAIEPPPSDGGGGGGGKGGGKNR